MCSDSDYRNVACSCSNDSQVKPCAPRRLFFREPPKMKLIFSALVIFAWIQVLVNARSVMRTLSFQGLPANPARPWITGGFVAFNVKWIDQPGFFVKKELHDWRVSWKYFQIFKYWFYCSLRWFETRYWTNWHDWAKRPWSVKLNTEHQMPKAGSKLPSFWCVRIKKFEKYLIMNYRSPKN